MAIGTTEIAPSNEFGDDRDAADVKLREIDSLEQLLELDPEGKTDIDSDVEGGRTLFSNILPRAIGSTVLENTVRASTVNFAAGTARERTRQSPRFRQARYLGQVGLPQVVRRAQGFPLRPGR